MILHNVTDRTHLFKKSATTLHAKILGHRDLHTLPMVAIPNWFQKGICKSEKHHVVNGRLTEIVVDPKDISLPKRLQQNRVELDRRSQIAPEGLLDDHARPACAIRFRKLLDDQPEHR